MEYKGSLGGLLAISISHFRAAPNDDARKSVLEIRQTFRKWWQDYDYLESLEEEKKIGFLSCSLHGLKHHVVSRVWVNMQALQRLLPERLSKETEKLAHDLTADYKLLLLGPKTVKEYLNLVTNLEEGDRAVQQYGAQLNELKELLKLIGECRDGLLNVHIMGKAWNLHIQEIDSLHAKFKTLLSTSGLLQIQYHELFRKELQMEAHKLKADIHNFARLVNRTGIKDDVDRLLAKASLLRKRTLTLNENLAALEMPIFKGSDLVLCEERLGKMTKLRLLIRRMDELAESIFRVRLGDLDYGEIGVLEEINEEA